MIKRLALRTIAATVCGLWAGAVSAALNADLEGALASALSRPTPQEIASALHPLFANNPDQAVAIATEGARLEPAACGELMSGASAAAPDQAVDIAAGIIAVAPDCEEQVATILSRVLETAAGAEDLPPGTGGAPGFPAPSPITSVSTTAENPGTDGVSQVQP